MALSYCCHDHVVLLLGQSEFERPPPWLADNFKIIEGGTHSGGTSKNKLVVFRDGTYLELFTFIAEPAEFTSWAGKPAGLIDWALTTLRPFNADENFKHLSRRLMQQGDGALGVEYTPPQRGGRKRLDGKSVEWTTTRPKFSDAQSTPSAEYFPTTRIDAPFFCHDITPRVIRVPFDEDELTKHPCGATGIAAVDVLVPPDKLSVYSDLYASITGAAPEQISHVQRKGVSFKLTTPTSQGGGPVLRVRVPTSEEDRDWLRERGVGIREIELCAEGQQDSAAQGLSKEGIGTTVSLVKATGS